MDLFGELRALLRDLEARAIDYALCGGVALAIHGAPRATQDIDLLILPADLERLREAARASGFNLESTPIDFASGITIQRFTKLIGGIPLMLDVLLVSAAIENIWADRIAVTLDDGTPVHVVSRQGLISLKLAAARPQDIVDVSRLRELERG